MRNLVKHQLLSLGLTGLMVSLVALCGCQRRTEHRPERAAQPSEQAREPKQPATAPGERPTMPAAGRKETPATEPSKAKEVSGAEAELKTTEATKLTGKAKFTKTADGVRVVLEVENAKPGKYGVHIHEKGDCSNIAGMSMSMGKHFNPLGYEHGLPTRAKRHLGDLGNIIVRTDGKGRLDETVREATLERGGKMSFLGKALIIHSGVDKGTGESGDSGKPMACGVIESD